MSWGKGGKFTVCRLVLALLERPTVAGPIGPSTVSTLPARTAARSSRDPILVEAEQLRPDPRVTPRPRGILQQKNN